MISSVQNLNKTSPFVEFNRDRGYYITPKTAKDIVNINTDEKNKRIGLKIVSTALLTALGIFALMKGLPKNTYKRMGNWSEKLQKKIAERISLGEKGPVTSFYEYINKNIKSFSEKSKSINNIVSFKDLLFSKWMSNFKVTRSFHTKITTLFERLGRRTVKAKYNASKSKFSKLFETYSDINERILSKTPEGRLILEQLKPRIAKIETRLQAGFGEGKIRSRYKSMKEATIGLDKKVWDASFGDVTNFKKKGVYQTFVAESALSANKSALRKNVLAHSELVTSEMSKTLDLYKGILPQSEYEKINKITNTARKKLDVAINTETDQFFDKLRDLKLGSAPTDVFSVIGSVGAVGYGLSKADNNDEKTSILLRYGIPVVGAVVTSLAMTASLVAGAKSMILGMVSGMLMSRVGESVDNFRKKQ